MEIQTQRGSDWPLRWLPLAWFSLAFIALVLGVVGSLTQNNPMDWLMQRIGVSNPGAVGIILHEAGMLLAVLILLRGLRSQGDALGQLGLRGGLSWRMVGYAVAGALIAFVTWPLLEGGITALGIPMQWWQEEASLLSTTADLVWLVVAAGFFSPVLEEVLFRGYVLHALLARVPNRTVAILLAVFIFDSIHILFGPGTLLMIFPWTFIPIWLTLRFKSLYPAILMHILNNLLAYIVVPLVI